MHPVKAHNHLSKFNLLLSGIYLVENSCSFEIFSAPKEKLLVKDFIPRTNLHQMLLFRSSCRENGVSLLGRITICLILV